MFIKVFHVTLTFNVCTVAYRPRTRHTGHKTTCLKMALIPIYPVTFVCTGSRVGRHPIISEGWKNLVFKKESWSVLGFLGSLGFKFL